MATMENGTDPTVANCAGDAATIGAIDSGAATIGAIDVGAATQVHVQRGPTAHVDDYAELVAIDREHYVIGDELARGGMGRILRARDRRLGRPVAIKELLLRSEEWRRRFEREARITARLQHPAIVNVVEAGTWPNGDPFYAMKLVAGRSLDAAIAERATLEARLGLLPHLIAVVDALAYAHNARIIHRDLKPANVLVGEFGETVVIDWGLAKDLGEPGDSEADAAGPFRARAAQPGDTVDGTVMGTPAYMPPEQALGETVDERADVYSLGAMLYHLLVGAAPYTGPTSAAILAAVVAGPPVSIEQRVAGVPPDLIAIVAKAMATAAGDRYADAAALAADLKRFQTGQLVGVHRYTTWQLVRRWVRRHRAAVVVASVAIAVLSGFGIVSVREIVAARGRADDQRVVAQTHRGKAEDLLSFMLGDLNGKLKRVGKLELLDDVAKKAVGYFADVPDAADETVWARRERARAVSNLADVMSARGDLESGLAQHRRALAMMQRLFAEEPWLAERYEDLAQCHQKLGQALIQQRKPADALVQHEAALALRTLARDRGGVINSHRMIAQARTRNNDVKNALASLRTAVALSELLSADGHRDLVQQALVYKELGDMLGLIGKSAEAEQALRTALAITEQVVAADPSNALRLRDLAQAHHKLGLARDMAGDAADAVAHLRESLRILERPDVADPTNTFLAVDVWRAQRGLGVALLHAKQADVGVAYLKQALETMRRLTHRDPSNLGWRADFASTHSNVGIALAQQGDVAGAIAYHREALAIWESEPSDDVSWWQGSAFTYGRLGEALRSTGDLDGAIESFRKGVAAAEHVVAKDPGRAKSKQFLAEHQQRLAAALAAKRD